MKNTLALRAIEGKRAEQRSRSTSPARPRSPTAGGSGGAGEGPHRLRQGRRRRSSSRPALVDGRPIAAAQVKEIAILPAARS